MRAAECRADERCGGEAGQPLPDAPPRFEGVAEPRQPDRWTGEAVRGNAARISKYERNKHGNRRAHPRQCDTVPDRPHEASLDGFTEMRSGKSGQHQERDCETGDKGKCAGEHSRVAPPAFDILEGNGTKTARCVVIKRFAAPDAFHGEEDENKHERHRGNLRGPAKIGPLEPGSVDTR